MARNVTPTVSTPGLRPVVSVAADIVRRALGKPDETTAASLVAEYKAKVAAGLELGRNDPNALGLRDVPDALRAISVKFTGARTGLQSDLQQVASASGGEFPTALYDARVAPIQDARDTGVVQQVERLATAQAKAFDRYPATMLTEGNLVMAKPADGPWLAGLIDLLPTVTVGDFLAFGRRFVAERSLEGLSVWLPLAGARLRWMRREGTRGGEDVGAVMADARMVALNENVVAGWVVREWFAKMRASFEVAAGLLLGVGSIDPVYDATYKESWWPAWNGAGLFAPFASPDSPEALIKGKLDAVRNPIVSVDDALAAEAEASGPRQSGYQDFSQTLA